MDDIVTAVSTHPAAIAVAILVAALVARAVHRLALWAFLTAIVFTGAAMLAHIAWSD